MYLLDTNVCINLLNNQQPEVKKKFRSLSPSEIALCSIVKAELFFGARNSNRIDANLQRLHFFFAPLQSLSFNDLCADEYGLIRTDLQAQGKLIGPNDLLIAAIARTHQAILVTHNTKEFNRISGLRLADWESQ
ncbi:MAG: VapC toxin family PIN domain ribonuclease [Gammaproteobacteria bacterium]|nr:MAG: VapC toxin family PIN domain ribonuclease [Gammaproteobacteria bacterium]